MEGKALRPFTNVGVQQNDEPAGAEVVSDSDFMWNANTLEMPERSKLYYLEPIGLLTGEGESVTSYLARLAKNHTVSIWNLLKYEIGPKLFGSETVLRYRLGELVTTMGAAFNGENGTSKSIVSILERLTGRKDLKQTSMTFCKSFVSPRFLVRVKQSWCSECLSEWKAAGREIYSPLLWHLMAVNVCPKHGIPLRRACHECGKSFPPLTARSHVGFCPRCGSWLGICESSSEAVESPQTFDLEIARLACNFLRDGPDALTASGESVFPQNIDLLVRRFFGGNVAALARFLKVNRYTIIGWRAKTQRPTLLSLADLSLKVSVSPTALLSVRLQGDEFVLRTDISSKVNQRRFVPPHKLNLRKMQLALEKAIEGDVSKSPSLGEIASQLGCDQTTLVRRFPELAKKVKERHRQYCADRKENRAKQLESIVRKVTIDIHNSGNYPSQYKVRQALPCSIDMRDPPANKAWKQTLVELGLDFDRESMATEA
ncbi:MAG TPA: TniQ family protein [Verrucomicrobiae bacterium]|nr:TniQ family protein [Verrucomicrobiae bacterium]